MTPHILTVSGNYFNFEFPEQSTYTIEDIGHATANFCRFTGHVTSFYSVAEHCTRGSYEIAPEHALAFLLHDAAEGFTGDVSTPLKMMIKPLYGPIEERVERAILTKFGLSYPLHPDIKKMDLIMLASEKRDLMPASGGEWDMLKGVKPLGKIIKPWSPKKAKRMFLERFYELTEKVC